MAPIYLYCRERERDAVTPLGIAFETCGGWPEDEPNQFAGNLKVT